jgi:hypothetical protein
LIGGVLRGYAHVAPELGLLIRRRLPRGGPLIQVRADVGNGVGANLGKLSVLLGWHYREYA